jgi:hypothetical protein
MMSSNRPQSQASLQDQLRQLIVIANREGLYDAADYLRDALEVRARTRMKTTLGSKASLQLIIDDMNPRQRLIFDRIGHDWKQVYMMVQGEDIKYFERLGLIETRRVIEHGYQTTQARRL